MLTETSAHTQNKICGSYHYHLRVEQVTCVSSAVRQTEEHSNMLKHGSRGQMGSSWNCTHCVRIKILMKTKIRIFNIHVNSVLLYGCGAWKMIIQIANKLQIFVNRRLRRIMSIRWPKINSNTELWEVPDRNL